MLYVQLQYDNGIEDESWREKMEWNVGEAYSALQRHCLSAQKKKTSFIPENLHEGTKSHRKNVIVDHFELNGKLQRLIQVTCKGEWVSR